MAIRDLVDNVYDQMTELEAKLGYTRGDVLLHYLASSIANLLDVPHDEWPLKACDDGTLPEFSFEAIDEVTLARRMVDLLRGHASDFEEAGLGNVVVRNHGDRLQLIVPAVGSAYVHEHCKPSALLAGFLELYSAGDLSVDDIESLFAGFGEYRRIDMVDQDFDVAFWLEGAEAADSWRYCIKREPGHLNCHRFTQQDFEIRWPQ